MIKISILKTAVLFHLLAALVPGRAGCFAGRRMDSGRHIRLLANRHAGLEPLSECRNRRFQNRRPRSRHPHGTGKINGVPLVLPPGRGESRFHSTLRSESFPEFGRLDYEIRIPFEKFRFPLD